MAKNIVADASARPELSARMAEETMTEEEAETMLAKVLSHPPLLSGSDVDAIESVFQSPDFGRRRRCALAGAMQSGAELSRIKDDRELAVVLAGVMAAAGDQSRKLAELAEVFSALSARIVVALAMREDFQNVMDEGAEMVGCTALLAERVARPAL
ncbi:MAG: hypothetical protein H0X13_16380 [Ramlibacter sp.]|nr:hypothetical protein [Ramlibacter sp.]